jgi:hypothetical protein
LYRCDREIVEPVFGQLRWDGKKVSMDLPSCSRQAWFGESAGAFLLMCPVHHVKKIVKKVLQGSVTSLLGKHGKLVEEAVILRCREQK